MIIKLIVAHSPIIAGIFLKNQQQTNEKKEYCRLLVNIGCFTIVLVCFYTRVIGRAQAPDMTLGGVSGTISSSSLYQWNVVSFFTLAT